MGNNILNVKNLSISYNEKNIVKNINFDLKSGEILAIVGESGSGKSTILKAIAGILDENAKINGEIYFEGQEIVKLEEKERKKLAGESISVIFQNSAASFCPILTIGAQIYESVKSHKNCSYDEFLMRAKKIIKNINLDESILNEYPFRLSGGMAQRAGILAAMILEPKLILADEPTSALDTVTQFKVVKELLKIREVYQNSIIIVTHNLKLAKYMTDKIFVMNEDFYENFRSEAC